MTITALALLKAALANHLAPETDYVSQSKFACHAVNYAEQVLTGDELAWGYTKAAMQAKAAIKEYIGGCEDAETYLTRQGLDTDVFEFRKKMLADLIERFETIAVLEKAKELLWNGEGPRITGEKERYACIAVTYAAGLVQGFTKERMDEDCDCYVAVKDSPVVKKLHEQISQHIHGYYTVESYFVYELKPEQGFTMQDAQQFRVAMIDSFIKGQQ